MRMIVAMFAVVLMTACAEELAEREFNFETWQISQEQLQLAYQDAQEEGDTRLAMEIEWMVSRRGLEYFTGYKGTLSQLIRIESGRFAELSREKLARLEKSQADYEATAKVITEFPVRVLGMKLKKSRTISWRDTWFGVVEIENSTGRVLYNIRYLMRVSDDGEILAETEARSVHSWRLEPVLAPGETRKFEFEFSGVTNLQRQFYTPRIVNSENLVWEISVVGLCDDNNKCIEIGQDVTQYIKQSERDLKFAEAILARHSGQSSESVARSNRID